MRSARRSCRSRATACDRGVCTCRSSTRRATSGHDITDRDVHGPARSRPTRSPSGRRSSAGRSRPTAGSTRVEPTEHGEAPITAVHDQGLVRFLEVAWSEVRRQAAGGAVPVGRHVPEPGDVRGDERRGRRRGSCASPSTRPAGPGFWGLDSAAPLVAGTYVAARGGRGRGAHDGRPRARRRDGRLRPVPAARPPCRAVDVRRVLLLQQRRDRRRGDHRGDAASGSRSSTSTTTTATAPSRSSGAVATCATCRSTPTRSGRTRTSSAAPTRPGRGQGPART